MESTLEAYRKLLSIPLLAEWTPLGLGSSWKLAGDDSVIWLSPVLVSTGSQGVGGCWQVLALQSCTCSTTPWYLNL